MNAFVGILGSGLLGGFFTLVILRLLMRCFRPRPHMVLLEKLMGEKAAREMMAEMEPGERKRFGDEIDEWIANIALRGSEDEPVLKRPDSWPVGPYIGDDPAVLDDAAGREPSARI